MEYTIAITPEEAKLCSIGTPEQWTPTTGFRFRQEKALDGFVYYQQLPVLQQMWAETFSGRHEWRDVPTVEE